MKWHLRKSVIDADDYMRGYNIKPSATNINGVITVNIDHFGKYYTQNILDLYPECSDSFKKWLSKESDVKENS